MISKLYFNNNTQKLDYILIVTCKDLLPEKD